MIANLPNDVWQQIFQELDDPTDWAHLGATCRTLHNLLTERALWVKPYLDAGGYPGWPTQFPLAERSLRCFQGLQKIRQITRALNTQSPALQTLPTPFQIRADFSNVWPLTMPYRTVENGDRSLRFRNTFNDTILGSVDGLKGYPATQVIDDGRGHLFLAMEIDWLYRISMNEDGALNSVRVPQGMFTALTLHGTDQLLAVAEIDAQSTRLFVLNPNTLKEISRHDFPDDIQELVSFTDPIHGLQLRALQLNGSVIHIDPTTFQQGAQSAALNGVVSSVSIGQEKYWLQYQPGQLALYSMDAEQESAQIDVPQRIGVVVGGQAVRLDGKLYLVLTGLTGTRIVWNVTESRLNTLVAPIPTLGWNGRTQRTALSPAGLFIANPDGIFRLIEDPSSHRKATALFLLRELATFGSAVLFTAYTLSHLSHHILTRHRSFDLSFYIRKNSGWLAAVGVLNLYAIKAWRDRPSNRADRLPVA